MIIKSAPPASSNFADMPVPAPQPMIGSPRAILSLRFLMISFLGMRRFIFPSPSCWFDDRLIGLLVDSLTDEFRYKRRR